MNKFIEYNFFKSEKANKHFNYWINNDPEYFRASDLQVFTDMVIHILDNDENLEYFHLTNSTHRLTEYMISTYIERYFIMKAVYDKLRPRFNNK